MPFLKWRPNSSAGDKKHIPSVAEHQHERNAAAAEQTAADPARITDAFVNSILLAFVQPKLRV